MRRLITWCGTILLSICFLAPIEVLAENIHTQEEVYAWYEQNMQKGGTLSLHQDLVFSSSEGNKWFDNDYQQEFIIDMQGHNIIIDNHNQVIFNNFTFENVGQIEIRKESEMSGENLLIQVSSREAAIVHEGELFLNNSIIENTDGIGILDKRNLSDFEDGYGDIYMSNIEIHAKTALITKFPLEVFGCYMDGDVQAASIVQDTSVIKSSNVTPEIVRRTAFYDYNYSEKQTYYLNYHNDVNLYYDYLPTSIDIYPQIDGQSQGYEILPLSITFDDKRIPSNMKPQDTFTLKSDFVMNPFLKELIQQKILDFSYIEAPEVKLKAVDSFSLLTSVTNRNGLNLYVEMPPALQADSVQFAIAKDGRTWYYSNDIADDLKGYSKQMIEEDYPYIPNVAFYSNKEKDELYDLEKNKQYDLKFEINGGMYDGVVLDTKLSTYDEDIDSNFIYKIALEDHSHEVEEEIPDEKPDPDVDGSIDGNRGGGGQSETSRDEGVVNNPSIEGVQEGTNEKKKEYAASENKEITTPKTQQATKSVPAQAEKKKELQPQSNKQGTEKKNLVPVYVLLGGIIISVVVLSALLINRKLIH